MGDEVLTTTQDYGRMINTFKQRECRDGIVMKQFKIPTPSENENEIVDLFEKNISNLFFADFIFLMVLL